MKEEKAKVSIFGSCVSKIPVSEYCKDYMDLTTFISKQTILSSVSAPTIWEDDGSEFESESFKFKFVTDVEKTGFQRLKEDGSDYIIIDLIDERLGCIAYQNSFITYAIKESWPFGFLEGEMLQKIAIERKVTKEGYFFFIPIGEKEIPLTDYLDLFSSKVLDLYKGNNIILHKFYWSNHYKNEVGEMIPFRNERANDMNLVLRFMYDYLEEKFQNCYVINESHLYFADVNSTLTLAPVHFADDYSEVFAKRIEHFFYFRSLNSFVEVGQNFLTPFVCLCQKMMTLLMDGSSSLETGKTVVFWGCGRALHHIFDSFDRLVLGEALLREYETIQTQVQYVDQNSDCFFQGEKIQKPEFILSLEEDLVAVIVTPEREDLQASIQERLVSMGVSKEKILRLEECMC